MSIITFANGMLFLNADPVVRGREGVPGLRLHVLIRHVARERPVQSGALAWISRRDVGQ